MSIDAHYDAGRIMAKKGGRPHIGICGLLRRKIGKTNKDQVYLEGMTKAWPSGKWPRQKDLVILAQ